MENRKKKAAAIAAVISYIKKEEEIKFRSSPVYATAPPMGLGAPVPQLNLWRLSGRQDQMQLKIQMHMKAFHRFNTHKG